MTITRNFLLWKCVPFGASFHRNTSTNNQWLSYKNLEIQRRKQLLEIQRRKQLLEKRTCSLLFKNNPNLPVPASPPRRQVTELTFSHFQYYGVFSASQHSSHAYTQRLTRPNLLR
jgi:hypothetical protein